MLEKANVQLLTVVNYRYGDQTFGVCKNVKKYSYFLGKKREVNERVGTM